MSGEAAGNIGVQMRKAREDDLEAIVDLLADDGLGQSREDSSRPLAAAYRDAFRAIEADPNQLLLVADVDGEVTGTLQLSFIPGLSRLGAWRGQIEAVRVSRDARGSGLGQKMIEWAIGECRRRGCSLVQLTSDKSRSDALRFYERLGFRASHEGFKLTL
ncbi:MAG: GNAT family N-acetyltransferase [Pseudomonadota bacterium]|nr:GNAT family N-acetyltransferase [Pseudomonadota bacterium]